MRPVVISAVNFSEGGPLTVLRSCLASARELLPPQQEIIALVHDRRLFETPDVRYIEFPQAKRSWASRLRLEYVTFGKLAAEWRPGLWLSLHDISPRLPGDVPQAVYCHNPAPFFRPRLADALFEPTLLAFRLFYGRLYRLNLQSNRWVIVQQDWLRRVFSRRYGAKHVVVAHPSVEDLPTIDATQPSAKTSRTVVLYPTIARAFKNIETVCAAMVIAVREGFDGELRVTIDGTENRYARWLRRKFADYPAIRFIGRRDRAAMLNEYAGCDALAFPSRLETWGLPITEAKMFGKPILVSDLPYARETVGTYGSVRFLSADDPRTWANSILALGRGDFAGNATAPTPSAPYVTGWRSLWLFLAAEFGLPLAS